MWSISACCYVWLETECRSWMLFSVVTACQFIHLPDHPNIRYGSDEWNNLVVCCAFFFFMDSDLNYGVQIKKFAFLWESCFSMWSSQIGWPRVFWLPILMAVTSTYFEDLDLDKYWKWLSLWYCAQSEMINFVFMQCWSFSLISFLFLDKYNRRNGFTTGLKMLETGQLVEVDFGALLYLYGWVMMVKK